MLFTPRPLRYIAEGFPSRVLALGPRRRPRTLPRQRGKCGRFHRVHHSRARNSRVDFYGDRGGRHTDAVCGGLLAGVGPGDCARRVPPRAARVAAGAGFARLSEGFDRRAHQRNEERPSAVENLDGFLREELVRGPDLLVPSAGGLVSFASAPLSLTHLPDVYPTIFHFVPLNMGTVVKGLKNVRFVFEPLALIAWRGSGESSLN